MCNLLGFFQYFLTFGCASVQFVQTSFTTSRFRQLKALFHTAAEFQVTRFLAHLVKLEWIRFAFAAVARFHQQDCCERDDDLKLYEFVN